MKPNRAVAPISSRDLIFLRRLIRENNGRLKLLFSASFVVMIAYVTS